MVSFAFARFDHAPEPQKAKSSPAARERAIVTARVLLHEALVRALQLSAFSARAVALAGFGGNPDRRLAANTSVHPHRFVEVGPTF
jgi:hypothetical protein